MNKLVSMAFYPFKEAIRWRLCNGESLRGRLIDTALNEIADEDNAASLIAEVFFEHNNFIVEVRIGRTPVLACICGECADLDHYFKCRICGHDTPWCRGADDQYPDLCDDCAVKEQA